MRSERLGTPTPDRPSAACLRAAGLAPGGFVFGYVGGRVTARAFSECPLFGFCADVTPVLVALSCAVLGLGVGNTLAALRVRYWWEGVVVWAAGILATLILVALVGLLGPTSLPGLLVSTAWALAAVGLTVATLRRRWRPITE